MEARVAPMAAHTGYRLIKLGEQLLDLAEHTLEATAVRPRHLNVLVTLLEHAELSQLELSALLGIDVNTMVTVIDHLEREGLAVRERNPRDRRRHVVWVTEAGRAEAERDTVLMRTAEAEFFSVLTSGEQTHLHDLTGCLLRLPAAVVPDS